MKKALITGGAGFFGGILENTLLAQGWQCVNIDLEKDPHFHPNLISIQGDIRNQRLLKDIFRKYEFDVVFHCAAILAHAVKDKKFLWESNVDGTRNIAECAKKFSVKKVVFISSNCLWAENMNRPVHETDVPNPVEIYGQSKWEGEKILMQYQVDFDVVIFRTPTIIDAGRLGLLAILFEFIAEGRKVWVVGEGQNRYQFVYAQDMVDACVRAVDYPGSIILNVGSDKVKSFREVYEHVIHRAQTNARVASLPKDAAIFFMKSFHKLKISPLGPYQYKMIAEDFVFDTKKIKQELGWTPTYTNEEMLWKGYEYFVENQALIKNRKNVSAHKQSANMGVIRILKWIS